MASRRTRWPAAALLTLLVVGAGCAQPTETGPPPAPAGMAAAALPDPGPAAVDIALRRTGQPLPDVVGETVERARRALEAAGVRTQVVAFDADAPVTAQHPRGGESPPANGVVTVWAGGPPQLPSPPAPASPPAPDPPPDGDAAGADPVTVADASPVPLPSPDPAGNEPAGEQADEPEAPREAPRTSGGEPSRSRPTATVLEGPATWYGPGFAGNRTACGGRFDPDDLTMASRELPCGTRARVTGPSGRSVEVTVTDWGPAEWTGKRFDLSAAAFAEIANLSAGVVPVTVEVLR